MRENYEGIRGSAKDYSEKDIDDIVKLHEEKLLNYCKSLERQFAGSGLYNTYENMRVLFDLRNFELHSQVSGQAISQEVVEGIEQGVIIEVYEFRTGALEEIAFEGLNYGEDCEAKRLYTIYRDDEISEEEYFEKYEEVIEPWIWEYMEDYLDTTVEIKIDYLNAIEKDDYDSLYEI